MAKRKSKVEQLKRKLAKNRMIKALTATEGHVSKACKLAKCGRTQHYEWLKEDAKYNQKVEDINEADIDETEELLKRRGKGFKYKEIKEIRDSKGKLIKKIVTEKTMAPSVDALKVRLAAKGKKRGYGSKQIDHKISEHHITLDLGDGVHKTNSGEVSKKDS